jgi:putative transposase
MPRTARAARSGIRYHVINRGNARAAVFRHPDDFAQFAKYLWRGLAHAPVDIFAYCLMPNHFHLVVRPGADDALARWMHWVTTAYAKWYRRIYAGPGHIWQGRYKAFSIAADAHLLRVVRYVERNALRALLVPAAETWPWGSLHLRCQARDDHGLHPLPIDLPNDWCARVNAPESEDELKVLRASVNRGRPYGDRDWVAATAATLGVQFSLRRRGRPRRTGRKGGEPGSTAVISIEN